MRSFVGYRSPVQLHTQTELSPAKLSLVPKELEHATKLKEFGCAAYFKNVKQNIDAFSSDRQTLMKNGVFWDVTPCGSCKNRRFEGT
jgi:hypothetical protein